MVNGMMLTVTNQIHTAFLTPFNLDLGITVQVQHMMTSGESKGVIDSYDDARLGLKGARQAAANL